MDIQEIADSMQPFTPVIQWGAVSQKWHVTFADWKDDVYTGDTILLALQAAQQGVQADGACTCANRHIGEDHICVNCGGVA